MKIITHEINERSIDEKHEESLFRILEEMGQSNNVMNLKNVYRVLELIGYKMELND